MEVVRPPLLGINNLPCTSERRVSSALLHAVYFCRPIVHPADIYPTGGQNWMIIFLASFSVSDKYSIRLWMICSPIVFLNTQNAADFLHQERQHICTMVRKKTLWNSKDRYDLINKYMSDTRSLLVWCGDN